MNASGEFTMGISKRGRMGWVARFPDGTEQLCECWLDAVAALQGHLGELWAGTFWAGEGGAEEVLNAAE